MYLYQLNHSRILNYIDENHEQSVLFTHTKEYTEEQFQNIINSELFEMGHYKSFYDLVDRLKEHGFKKVSTGYYTD